MGPGRQGAAPSAILPLVGLAEVGAQYTDGSVQPEDVVRWMDDVDEGKCLTWELTEAKVIALKDDRGKATRLSNRFGKTILEYNTFNILFIITIDHGSTI